MPYPSSETSNTGPRHPGVDDAIEGAIAVPGRRVQTPDVESDSSKITRLWEPSKTIQTDRAYPKRSGNGPHSPHLPTDDGLTSWNPLAPCYALL